MESSFDVITVGNATIDLFLSIQDTNKHFRLNEETKELCVHHGDKALIDKVELLLGGNASNIAVGVSRLGFKSAILAEIGVDEFSQKIVNGLKNEGVDESFLKKTENAPSLLSVIINFKVERTIFVEDIEMNHDFELDNLKTKWLYLTSLGKKWEEAYRKVAELCQKNGARLAFNPGTLQLDCVFEKIAPIIKISEALFVNKEEAKIILKAAGKNISPDDVKTYLSELKSFGPKIVVITDGLNGSHAIDETNEIFYYEIIDSEVVERTGAGDSYTSGFLSAIIAGQTIKNAMAWGTYNAASVVGKVGAQTGLLKKEELEEKLK